MPYAPASPCPRCKRIGPCSCQRSAPRPKTAARGYGAAHRRLRASFALEVAAGGVDCARCGLLIEPEEPWDLGHTADRLGYTGPEHSRCNRAVARQRTGGGSNKAFSLPAVTVTPQQRARPRNEIEGGA
jgi:hypothetical protein